MKGKWIFVLAGLSLALSACVTPPIDSSAVPALHKQAAFDLDCPQDQIQISELSEDKYGAKGCNRRAEYRVHHCNAVTENCRITRIEPVSYSDPAR
jgi:hypothetical protein